MLSQTILRVSSRLISLTLPPTFWYRAALAVSGLGARLLRLTGIGSRRPYRFEQAILLNRMLAYLTRRGEPFPIPWRVIEEFQAPQGSGVIACSAHLPLIKIAGRALMDSGYAVRASIAARPDPDGCIALWGLRERLPALKVGPSVLLQTRTELRRGSTVILLVDSSSGDYSPNIFRLARVTGAALLFLTAELAEDGVVEVRFFRPPAPECSSPEEITSNLLALDAAVRQISGRVEAPRFDTTPAIG